VIEWRQEWVPARQTQDVAWRCEKLGGDGWALHTAAFGERYWAALPDEPQRTEEGWLLLFSRQRYPGPAGGVQEAHHG